MIPEKIKNILETLNKHGEAYLVGGCIRDQLLGIEPKDYDIATNLPSNEVLSLFEGSKYVGESFGVVLVDGVEIASYRKDVYNPVNGELNGVEFVNTLEEDLGRRDFTINAMAMDIEGNIIDPYDGRSDLEERIIRFVGNPLDRIEEDPVRMIRACRFLGKIDGVMENNTGGAILENMVKIQRVANERIRIEILKIMELKNFYKTIKSFHMFNLNKYILPSLFNCIGVEQNKHHNENVFEHNVLSANAIPSNRPLLRLAMLLHDIGKPATKTYDKEIDDCHFYNHEIIGEKLARDLLTTLKFSNKEIKYVCGIIRNHMFNFSGNETTHSCPECGWEKKHIK